MIHLRLRLFPLLLLASIGLSCLGCSSSTHKPVPPATVPAASPTHKADQSFRTHQPKPGSKPAFTYPKTTVGSLVTPRGASLAWRASVTPSPTQSLRLTCLVGTNSDPHNQSGLAAITASMLTEGTLRLSRAEFWERLETLGTQMEYDAAADHLSLSAEVLPAATAETVQLLLDAMFSPRLAVKDFERIQKEWLDDLARERDEPSQLAWEITLRALLGPQLGRNPRGSPRSIARLKVADVQGFVAKELLPSRCALLSVGPESPERLSKELQLGHLLHDAAPRPKPPPTPLPPAEGTVKAGPPLQHAWLMERPDSVQTVLVIARRLVPQERQSSAFLSLQISNNLFGGLFTSRLNTNLREVHGYTYGAYSSLIGTRTWLAWTLQTKLQTAATLDGAQEALKELEALARPHPEGDAAEQRELDRSKADLLNTPWARLQHTESALDNLESEFVYPLTLDYYEKLPEQLAALDLNAVRKAHQVLSPDCTAAPASGSCGQGALLMVAVGNPTDIVRLKALAQSVTTVDEAWLDQTF